MISIWLYSEVGELSNVPLERGSGGEQTSWRLQNLWTPLQLSLLS